MLVILLSGVAMMIRLHEVWGAQLWFRVKMGLLLLIVVNGLGLRRVMGLKLKAYLAEVPQVNAATIFSRIKSRLGLIQVIQLLLFTLIYVLSVFKFN